MKIIAVTAQMFLLLLCGTGCGPANTGSSTKTDSGSNQLSEFGPVKVDIMPLTEFAAADGNKPSKIKVYVSMLDAFNCQMKTPAVFRFELYSMVPHSTEPKGKRIHVWSDIDLKNQAKNNEHWRDFLRAYEFDLPFEQKENQSCILQITALCQNGRRLTADFTLKQ
jgi:hypothetical protein